MQHGYAPKLKPYAQETPIIINNKHLAPLPLTKKYFTSNRLRLSSHMNPNIATESLPAKTAYVSELLNCDNYLTWEQVIKFTLEDEKCKEENFIDPIPTGENPFRVINSATTCRILLKSVDSAIRFNLLAYETGPYGSFLVPT